MYVQQIDSCKCYCKHVCVHSKPFNTDDVGPFPIHSHPHIHSLKAFKMASPMNQPPSLVVFITVGPMSSFPVKGM